MQNHDVKRLAVGIEQKSKNTNCGLIYENYLWQIWYEVCHMCRIYHLTDAQYEVLLRTTAERMMLPELIEELDDPGILAANASIARNEARMLMEGCC